MFFPNILPEHRQHWLLSASLLRARTFKFHFGPIHQRVWYCHWILLLSVHCTTLKSHLSPWPDLISKDFLRIILRPVTQLEWGASLVFSLGWGSYCPWLIWTRASPPPFFFNVLFKSVYVWLKDNCFTVLCWYYSVNHTSAWISYRFTYVPSHLNRGALLKKRPYFLFGG